MVIVRTPKAKGQLKSTDQWYKPNRVQPLWQRDAGKSLLTKIGDMGGRIFDENGNYRGGPNGHAYHGGLGSSDLYRLASPISDREESDRPYEENVWVRAGIKAISYGMQRLRFTLFNGDPKDDASTEVPKHPLLDLLASPNRITTERGLWQAHAVDMKHDGEEVWFFVNGDGTPVDADEHTGMLFEMPVSVVQVRGSLVEIKYDTSGMPRSYRYTTSFSRTNSLVSPEFPAGAVVHFRDYDPYNVVRGLGDVNALERELDLYFQAFRAMDGAVRNGGDPGGFIIYNHDVSNDEMQRRQDDADEEFSGPNQRRIKLLQADAKFFPNTVKPSDMQYNVLLTWLRDSILAGLGVPPPVVGVYDSATFNNVETAYRELWTGANGILALAASTSDVLTNDLLKRMDRVAPGSSALTAHFDSSGIEALREDVGERLDRAADIASKGVAVSFNEALEMQGVEVEQPEEGDRKWVAGTLTDLDDPEAGKREMPAAPEGDGGDTSDEDGDDPQEADESGNEDESEDEGEGSDAEQNAGVASIAFKRTDGLLEFDPVVKKRLLAWLTAYEKDQITQLRRIANPRSLAKYSVLDEFVNPEALSDEAWLALLLEKAPWSQRLQKDVRVALRDVYAAALADAHGEVGDPLITTTDPQVLEELATQRIKLAEGVTSVTQRRVRNSIARVMAGSAPPGTLRDMVKAVLPELTAELKKVFGSKDARAATIAQTETGQAENNAKFTQYEASNVETIQWIASQDEATRASHVAVHGQIITLGSRFDNGLRRPHDPEGRAGEVINCRCDFIVASRRDPLDDPDLDIS